MTLNITVTSPKRIFQCADFRYTSWPSGQFKDIGARSKLHAVVRQNWHATVCFNGVGETGAGYVSEWLTERLNSIQPTDPFERLYEELRLAERWLTKVPTPHNRHSFVIAGFNRARPVYALLTNYEDISGNASAVASSSLTLIDQWPKKPRTFVSGQPRAVAQEDRWRLTNLVAIGAPNESVFELLAQVNRKVADVNPRVSPGCFTTCIDRTGGTSGKAFGIMVPASFGDGPMSIGMPIPDDAKAALAKVLAEQHPGGAQLVQFASARFNDSEEFHRLQLRDKPLDPNVHCNYGNFLLSQRKDPHGAENAYRRALELAPRHVNSIGNLANILSNRGDVASAKNLYERALGLAPMDENVVINYAQLLGTQQADPSSIGDLLERSAAANPQSGKTRLALAQFYLRAGDPVKALEFVRVARGLGADQSLVEQTNAFALHMSGAPIGDRIAAYRTALAIEPASPAMNLNLAQLLFIRGETQEPRALLARALSSGLSHSDNLEAQFYRLAHTDADPEEIVTSMRASFSAGSRLTWNVDENVETVRARNTKRAASLEQLRQILRGDRTGPIEWPPIS